jgi:hypothetical protein
MVMIIKHPGCEVENLERICFFTVDCYRYGEVMTTENDVVLIYFEDRPISFARIEGISPDVRKDWYHVQLLLLQVPLQVVTWILRDIYINGEEFTMEGKKIRLEKVVCPRGIEPPDKKKGIPEEKSEGKKAQKVISLADLNKKQR